MSTETKMALGDLMRQLSATHESLVRAEAEALRLGDKEITDRVITLRTSTHELHQELLAKVGHHGA